MSDVVKEFDLNLGVEMYRVSVMYDHDVNPREWDNLATMLCSHGRYGLGDEQFSDTDSIVHRILDEIGEDVIYSDLVKLAEEKYSAYKPNEIEDDVWVLSTEGGSILEYSYEYDSEEEAEDALEEFKDDFASHEWREEMSYEDKMEIAEKYAYILPLYLYDHSGITMNTTGFNCRWDSGQVGEIFVTHKRAIHECPKTENETDEEYKTRIEGYLRDEVKEYDMHLTGDVYWYSIEEVEVCSCCGSENKEQVDSCGGFFGIDSVLEDGFLHFFDKIYHDEIKKEFAKN